MTKKTARLKVEFSKQGEENLSVRFLRTMLRQTQEQFAAFIGVSVDTVKSVETGRQRLTPKIAQRIRMNTGAMVAGLLMGRGDIRDTSDKPFSYAAFEHWQKMISPTDEAAARRHAKQIQGWIELVLLAAAKPGEARDRNRLANRLPAVYMSMVEWLEQIRQDFNLGPEIDAILKERSLKMDATIKIPVAVLRKHPEIANSYGFKDSKKYKEGDMWESGPGESWQPWAPAGTECPPCRPERKS